MKIVEAKSKVSERIVPILYTDDNKIVKEVFAYIKHLSINEYKLNTTRQYCYCLKTYYEWLNYAGFTYETVIEPKSQNNPGIMENFTNFKLWLKYGDYKNVIPINGHTEKRSPVTINLIFSCVLNFYDFLASYDKAIPYLDIYTDKRCNPQFPGLLKEMMHHHEKQIRLNVLRSRIKKKGLKYISKEKYEECYKVANNLRDRIIISLMFECGLRVSEVIGLEISDLNNLMDGYIEIVNHDRKDNPDAALKYDSFGSVCITTRLQNDIVEYMNTYLVNADTNYFVFNLYGETKYKPMRRNNIERIVRNIGKKVGIDYLHPHMFRHGLAVYLLCNGSPIELISDILRHKNITTTKNVYAQYDLTTKRKLANTHFEKVSTIFSNSSIDNDAFDKLTDILLQEQRDELGGM